MKAPSYKKSHRAQWPAIFMALLVSWMIGASFEAEVLHVSSHADELARLHSLVNELDPCHRAVYHEQQGEGCEHPTHVTEHEPCFLCGTAFHHEFCLVLSLSDISISAIATGEPVYAPDVVSLAGIISTSRAPPAC